MNSKITIKKVDLVDRLNARKAEIDAGFDAEIAKIDAELAYRASSASSTQQMLEYHREMAAAFEAGQIEVNGNGRVVSKQRGFSVPQKPKPNGYAIGGNPELQWYTVEQLEQTKEQTEEQRKYALKPLESTLDLLSISVGATIELETGELNALLTGQVRAGRRYY